MKNLLLILINVLLNSAAQILMRQGMLQIGKIEFNRNFISEIPKMLSSLWVWSSLVCYGISAIVWMVVLSRVEVSFSYPFVALGFVIVALAGYFLFQEQITLPRMIGIALICAGILFVARS
jgi:multidrug transporter EmrE-like cation transporter